MTNFATFISHLPGQESAFPLQNVYGLLESNTVSLLQDSPPLSPASRVAFPPVWLQSLNGQGEVFLLAATQQCCSHRTRRATAWREGNLSAAGTWNTAGKTVISLSLRPGGWWPQHIGPRQYHKYRTGTREVMQEGLMSPVRTVQT